MPTSRANPGPIEATVSAPTRTAAPGTRHPRGERPVRVQIDEEMAAVLEGLGGDPHERVDVAGDPDRMIEVEPEVGLEGVVRLVGEAEPVVGEGVRDVRGGALRGHR